jgi:DNA-binding XRE family transcriptional regulator
MSTTLWYNIGIAREIGDTRCLMESKEFSKIRHCLGKTQNQLGRLLCVSTKTIQSFEQGWRRIPESAERQLLLLLSLKRYSDENTGPCWEIQNCPAEWREKCAAWEFKVGYYCWFINGTFCQGKFQENWGRKIKLCRQCKVFRSMLPVL